MSTATRLLRKKPNNKLTVIIRDDSPMIFCGDSPTYRSVQIELTEDQVNSITLKYTSSSGKDDFYEEISKCFIEPN